MPARPLLLILGILALVWTGSREQVQDPSLDELLARTAEAYGGETGLRSVSAWRQTGRVTSPARGHGMTLRLFDPPDKLRVVTSFPGGAGEIRILNGAHGWRNGRLVTGASYQAMVLQAARLSLPLLLLEAREVLEDEGWVERREGRLRSLALPLRDGMRLVAEIEPESGRILRSRSEAGRLVFETLYSDFRRIGGVDFAFGEVTWAMGVSAGRTELDDVTLEEELPDRLFRP